MDTPEAACLLEAGTQLKWTSIVVRSLEEPRELTGILGSHLTQLYIAPVAPSPCLSVTDLKSSLQQSFVQQSLQCYAGSWIQLPFAY